MPAQTLNAFSRTAPQVITPGGVLTCSNPANVNAEWSIGPNGPWLPVPFVGNIARAERTLHIRAIALSGTVTIEIDNHPSAANSFGSTQPEWNANTSQKSGIRTLEGANAKQGRSTLVGGTVTIPNTSVTAASKIIYARALAGGTLGHLSTTRVNGTSFTILSSSGTDTSVVEWEIFEPA